MADHYARILGTEEDRINCPFFFKIGACRHGERCSRTHIRPNFSQTVVIPHFYTPPPAKPDANGVLQPVDDTEEFEDFYEEIMEELSKFGEVETLICLENLGDHMFGNVYVKFATEEEAEKCVQALRGRYYAGRLVLAEYSPVTSFGEARCRQFDEGHCARGGYCNFMHLRHVPRHLKKELHRLARKARHKRKYGDRSRSRSRDRPADRRKSRSRSPRKESGDSKKADSLTGRERDDDAARRARIASWQSSAAAAAAAGPASNANANASNIKEKTKDKDKDDAKGSERDRDRDRDHKSDRARSSPSK